jgi:glycosyltransferase involved in cell wall biosynthesis
MGGSHFDKFYGSQSQIYKIIIKRILKHVSCIIVRGENQKKQFENIYNGRIEVVYIPSTGILYNNKEFDFSKKEQINILFLAMIAQSKGAFDLLKAIPELVKKDDRLHFHFVGDVVKRETNITFLRSEYFSLKDFISRNQIQSKVTIHGSIKYRNKEIIFKNSDIFVFPSYSEGFPFAVVEAMEYQLPVISTRVGALSEIFRHEKEIYFIPKNSPEKISEAVVELINNPALVKNMIKNCNVVLESILSKKMFEEKMIGIFQNILLNNYQDR